MNRAISLWLVILLSACAGQVTEPSYYLLRGDTDPDSQRLEPSRHFALGSVSIAPYIDQPGLVLMTGANEMRAARQHLWAEPVHEAVRNLLLREISRTYGEDLLPLPPRRNARLINVRIDQLHGTGDGAARLVAYWWIGNENEVEAAYRSARTQPLSRDGYAALATALETLLTELAAEIARGMEKAKSEAE
ncbi:MAG: ABC-type transport auxiliary lipoprotein family protein [Halioglobus sp.]|nr:ABC-type transport auxiliary lipoprotein family protein [Halioglobus sp.]